MTDQSAELTKLRDDYDANLTELTKLREQVAHQTATIERLKDLNRYMDKPINAVTVPPSELHTKLNEAVALLRRFLYWAEGGFDYVPAFKNAATFIAAYDAERAEDATKILTPPTPSA